MLTRKQHELLLFINRHLAEHGVSPSFDEMKEALNLKSKSGIHRLITGLEERGFLKRLAHRARALEVVRLPDDVAVRAPASAPKPNHGFTPNVIPGRFRGPLSGATPNHSASEPANESSSIPLYGKIAAGTPIEALRDPSTSIAVPPSMLGRGEHYALTIEGDSMIEAGIYDGDTVIIERCDTAENGAIVVALVDEQEATLKRLRRNRGSIALEPANQAYETRIFGPDRVKVQGKLVGLLRRYN
ncbi:MAG TPA: transcriptional repressor LexA [Alphaproteobacteria bacterium]|jgi:repressor LexA|nr:transcriptional repressor LexA [Alphaproteobacteria bacterium]